MNKLTQLLRRVIPRKGKLSEQRALYLRDPGLRLVRQEQREVEARLRALEVQARVRARRR